jgi:FkbM family methyltransferase
MSFWYEPSYWEMTVQLPLRDLCRPGDVVFDVGANAGGLSVMMSRLVGPRGVVCAFEASPRIVDKTQYNVAMNGCGNVQIFHNAVSDKSGERLEIFAGSHLNDSILPHNGTSIGSFVDTIALDDFVDHWGLIPSLVKMDIEGAEFAALQGFARTIKTYKPYLILEQQPNDMRCHTMLSKLGYKAIDLATYQEICSAADFSGGAGVANLLFFPETASVNAYRPLVFGLINWMRSRFLPAAI